MYAFQIVSLFNDEFRLKDEPIDLLYIFPFMLVVAVALILMRKRMKFYIDAFNLKEKVEQKLSEL